MLVAPAIDSKKNQHSFIDQEDGGVKIVPLSPGGEDVEVILKTGARAWQCM